VPTSSRISRRSAGQAGEHARAVRLGQPVDLGYRVGGQHAQVRRIEVPVVVVPRDDGTGDVAVGVERHQAQQRHHPGRHGGRRQPGRAQPYPDGEYQHEQRAQHHLAGEGQQPYPGEPVRADVQPHAAQRGRHDDER